MIRPPRECPTNDDSAAELLDQDLDVVHVVGDRRVAQVALAGAVAAEAGSVGIPAALGEHPQPALPRPRGVPRAVHEDQRSSVAHGPDGRFVADLQPDRRRRHD